MSDLEYIPLNNDIDLSNLDFKDDNNKDTEKLQWFIKNRAHKYHRGNFALTYVIQYNKTNIGYFTLAASSITKKEVEEKQGVQTSPYLPSIIVAYFAVDRPYRKGQKGFSVGTEALSWVYGLARNVGQNIGCRYITLYAKNAIEFYNKNGFRSTNTKTYDGFTLMYKDLYPEKVSPSDMIN